MYGLKPVPFKLKPVPFKLKPVPFKLKPVPFKLKPVPFKLKPVPFKADTPIYLRHTTSVRAHRLRTTMARPGIHHRFTFAFSPLLQP